MIFGATVAAIIGVVAALFLAVRGLQSHGLTFERTAMMAVVWLLIIVVLAFVMSRLAA